MAYKIKSEYVKNKIKTRDFSNETHREYVDELIVLEKGALGKLGGFVDHMYLSQVERRYPEEHKAIMLELNPKTYALCLKRQARIDRELEKISRDCDIQEKKEEAGEKAQWLRIGGKA